VRLGSELLLEELFSAPAGEESKAEAELHQLRRTVWSYCAKISKEESVRPASLLHARKVCLELANASAGGLSFKEMPNHQ
jgi:hypothetical protein